MLNKSIFVLMLIVMPLLMAEEKVPCVPEEREEFSETKHETTIGGKPLSYKAVAGNLLLKDEKGMPKASLFFVSYSKDDTKNTQERPITFCFNGGPGSSSVWLHLGVFGPKRVSLTERGDVVPPYHLVDNEYSILDLTDLVFIDPVSTGYSRAIPAEDAKNFHGVKEDIKSVGEFIRLYLTRFNRWDSPKFLAGESYGTTRAAGLAGHLNDNYIHLNGVILISSVLNFQSVEFDSGNDFAYLAHLPSYTATAWYHQKLSPDLQQNLEKALQESRDFASHEYLLALFKGDSLSSRERQETIAHLARLTGLSAQYLERSNLRVDLFHYVKELLRDQNRTVGVFDSRFEGTDEIGIGEYSDYDPSKEAIFGAFTATFNHYIANDLKWVKDADYKILSGIHRNWDYSVATNQYLNVTGTLRDVMVKNPYLRVFVASGYFDLATPFFGTEYTFSHLRLPNEFADHVMMSYYPAGHMMYIHRPSLVKMKNDLTQYFTHTLQVQELEERSVK